MPEELDTLRSALLRIQRMYGVAEGDFLFKNPNTCRVWTTKSLEEDFARLCARAGILYGRDIPGGITIHSLRHACATNLVRAEVPLKVIADILGDTVATIEKYYVNLTEHDLGRGISRGPSFQIGRVDE